MFAADTFFFFSSSDPLWNREKNYLNADKTKTGDTKAALLSGPPGIGAYHTMVDYRSWYSMLAD